MTTTTSRRAFGLALLCATLAAALPPLAGAAGNTAKASRAEHIPRLTNGKPDFSGIWQTTSAADYDLEPHATRRTAGTSKPRWPTTRKARSSSSGTSASAWRTTAASATLPPALRRAEPVRRRCSAGNSADRPAGAPPAAGPPAGHLRKPPAGCQISTKSPTFNDLPSSINKGPTHSLLH